MYEGLRPNSQAHRGQDFAAQPSRPDFALRMQLIAMSMESWCFGRICWDSVGNASRTGTVRGADHTKSRQLIALVLSRWGLEARFNSIEKISRQKLSVCLRISSGLP
jgi:hypothetical protein